MGYGCRIEALAAARLCHDLC